MGSQDSRDADLQLTVLFSFSFSFCVFLDSLDSLESLESLGLLDLDPPTLGLISCGFLSLASGHWLHLQTY